MLVFTIISKQIYDHQRVWYIQEKQRLQNEIETLILMDEYSLFYQRVLAFAKRHRSDLRRKSFVTLVEDILFGFINKNNEKTIVAQAMAYELGLPERCIKNLKKRSSSLLLGCMQAKAYLYVPAIPYLLGQLQTLSFRTQYDTLMALARYDDPMVIVQAFYMIQNTVLVNERAVREIVKWMSPENRTILFNEILDLDSDYLSSLFLKCIDHDSANALKRRIAPLYTSDRIKELQIAAVKAVSVTGDASLLPIVLHASKSHDWELRSVAASGLGMFANGQVIEPLLAAICDTEWWVRHNAALSLLAQPEPEKGLLRALALNNRHANESLYYAAETQGMGGIFRYAQEETAIQDAPFELSIYNNLELELVSAQLSSFGNQQLASD